MELKGAATPVLFHGPLELLRPSFLMPSLLSFYHDVQTSLDPSTESFANRSQSHVALVLRGFIYLFMHTSQLEHGTVVVATLQAWGWA